MHQFAIDLEKFGKDNDIDVSGILENISGQLKKTWTNELTEYKTVYDEFMKAEIVRNDTLRPLYQESIQAVEEYNHALSVGKGVEEAKVKLESVQQSVKNATGELEGSQDVFNGIYEGINKDAEAAYSLDQSFKNDKSVQDYAEQLRGLSDVDLKAINFDNDNTEKGEEAFRELMEMLGFTEDQVQSLIDKLVELGYVQGEVQDSSASSPTSFSLSTTETEAIETYQKNIKTLSDALSDLNNLEATDITSLMTEFSSYGAVFEKFGVNEFGKGDIESALKAIAENLKQEISKKVPQMRSYIEEMYRTILNPNGNSNKLQIEADNLKKILQDIREGKSLDDIATAKLINKYPELADAVKVLTDGYSFEEDAIISLTNTKISAANKAIAWDIEQTKQEIQNARIRNKVKHFELQKLKKQGIQAVTPIGDQETTTTDFETLEDGYIKELEARLQELQEDFDNNLNFEKIIEKGTTFDWIEIAIERQKTVIQSLADDVDNTYLSWETRDKQLAEQITQTTKLIELQTIAQTEYSKKLDSIRLSEDYKNKIKNGKMIYISR